MLHIKSLTLPALLHPLQLTSVLSCCHMFFHHFSISFFSPGLSYSFSFLPSAARRFGSWPYILHLQTTVTSCLNLTFPSHLGTSLCSDNSNLASFAFLNLSLSYFPGFALLGIKFLLLFLLASLNNCSRLVLRLCPPLLLCSHNILKSPAVNPEEPLSALQV